MRARSIDRHLRVTHVLAVLCDKPIKFEVEEFTYVYEEDGTQE